MIVTSFCITLLMFTQSLLCMEQEPKNMLLQIAGKSTSFSNEIVEVTKERNIRISQLLENANTPKRLKMEISQLLENKNIIIDAYSIGSKTHPFEIKIAFYNDKTEHVAAYQIPQDYPLKAPIISLETTDDQINAKDLIAIKDDLNNELRQIWSPARKLNELVDTTSTKIQSYKNKKIASQLVAQGYERTLIHLKEKYQTDNLILSGKYPEFQEKLDGLWVKEMPNGYFVFHVKGDYINIAFEPKYIGEAPSLYYGYYAAGYHNTHNNKFNIHISDAADLGKTNAFNITVYPDHISIMFSSLKNDSILNAIISQLEMDYVIGSSINLIKIT